MWAFGSVLYEMLAGKLLDGRYVTVGAVGRSYDVAADDQRFLMLTAAGTAAPPSIVVIQHFDAELRRVVPTR